MARILAIAAGIAVATEPARRSDAVGLGGRPDIGAAEVGAIGIGIADGMDDRQVSAIPKLLERRGSRVHRPLIVELHRPVALDSEPGAIAIVVFIAEGNDR